MRSHANGRSGSNKSLLLVIIADQGLSPSGDSLVSDFLSTSAVKPHHPMEQMTQSSNYTAVCLPRLTSKHSHIHIPQLTFFFMTPPLPWQMTENMRSLLQVVSLWFAKSCNKAESGLWGHQSTPCCVRCAIDWLDSACVNHICKLNTEGKLRWCFYTQTNFRNSCRNTIFICLIPAKLGRNKWSNPSRLLRWNWNSSDSGMVWFSRRST